MTPYSPEPLIRHGAFVESPEAHRAVLDALDSAIVVFDADGLVRLANRQAEELFAAPEGGLVGLPVTDPRYPVYDEDGEVVPADAYPVTVAQQTGRSIEGASVRTQLPDGSPLWISVSANPIFEEGASAPHAVVASMSDITRYKEAESELARSNSDLSQFASVVAHDLSAPLSVIAGMAELVQRAAPDELDERSMLMLTRIEAAAKSGQSLIRELLDFAKAGQAELRTDRIDLRDAGLRDARGPRRARRRLAGDGRRRCRASWPTRCSCARSCRTCSPTRSSSATARSASTPRAAARR